MPEVTNPPTLKPQERVVPRPKLQQYVTPGYTMIYWFYMFELEDGTKHIIRLTGVENRDLVLQHAEQMHPGKTIDLHPLKDMEEIYEAAAKLKEDPGWYPIDAEALKEINNAALMADEPEPESGKIVIPGDAQSAARPIVVPGGVSTDRPVDIQTP